jgi:anaerobic selenocysteine-containing dehydrogenase
VTTARTVKTFCRVCEPSCGLVAEVDQGEIVSLKPDKEHPVSKGFACHKGIATLEIHQDKDRLNHPARRTESGALEQINWQQATTEIAERLKSLKEQYGAESIASYAGNPLAFNSLAGPAIGSFLLNNEIRRNFSSGTQDCANKFAASEAMFGSSTIHPIPDIENTDFMLIFGANPRVSHMSFISIADPMQALRDAKNRGADIRFVDPRKNESIKGIGSHLPIKPDTDVYLMAAILHQLFKDGAVDEIELGQYADNITELKEFVVTYSPEVVAGVTGISQADIIALARDIATASSACFYMSTGVNMGRQGSLAYWLLFMLSLVTGNLDKPGGNVYSKGFYPAAKAGRTNGEPQYDETPHGEIRRIRGSLPGNLLADMILAEDNPIRGLVVISGNPILSMGSGERLQEAFEKLEFVMVIDIYPSATSEFADYLLPATDMFERPDINICGLGMQKEPYIQYTDFVVPPKADRRPEWWILRQIEIAQGFPTENRELDDYAEAIEELGLFNRFGHMLNQTGHSLDDVKQSGTLVLPPVSPGRFFSDVIQTESGRVDCFPSSFAQAITRCEEILTELAGEPDNQLKMISRRTNYMINSWFHNVTSLKRPKHQNNPMYIHPDDARARNLGDGSNVQVKNEFGAVTTTVSLDDTLRPGTIAITHGWGYQGKAMKTANEFSGCNANNLLPSGPGSFEKISNQSFMTGIPVEVVAV